MAVLRKSCMVLGFKRRNLGLGGLANGVGGRRSASLAANGVYVLTLVVAAALGASPAQAQTAQGYEVAGGNVGTTGIQSIAIGGNSQDPNGPQGSTADATGDASIAIGNSSVATGDYSQAFGQAAKATAASAVAIGSGSKSTNTGSTAIGNDTYAAGLGALAAGGGNNGNGGVVGAVAMGNMSIALGRATVNAGATSSIALGTGATVSANTINAIAIGTGAAATAAGATAVGGNAAAGSKAAAIDSVAIGGQSAVVSSAISGVAIGRAAVASDANSVALGSGSVTAAPNPTSSGVINGTTYTYAGSAPTSVVSVGGVGTERQIANVAAGRVAGTSTDAINGSQLFATNSAVGTLGATVTNLGTTVATNLGGNSTYNSTTGAVSAPSYTINGTIYNNVGAAIAAATTHYYSVNDGGTQGGNYTNNGATGANSLAAGVSASATGIGGVAMGFGAKSTGTPTAGTANAGVAIGMNTLAYGTTVAIGLQSGSGGSSNVSGNVAVGSQTGMSVTASSNTAVGISAGSFVAGNGNSAYGALAGRNVTGGGNVGVGQQAGDYVNGSRNSAVGNAAGFSTTGDNNVAMGTSAGVTPTLATVKASDTVSVGTNAYGAVNSAVALGKGATANTSVGDVALGSGSVTAAPNPTASGVINGTTYAYAGVSPTSVVSVGAAGAERQITNVAAGRVSSTSTDAINGSQLATVASGLTHYYSVNSNGGGNFANDGATGPDAIAAGKNASSSGNGGVAVGRAAASSGPGAISIGSESSAAGNSSVAIGLQASSAGDNSTIVGTLAGFSSSIANNSQTAIGNFAGAFVVGDSNTSVGYAAGNSVKGRGNLGLGSQSGQNLSGDYNVGVGYEAGYGTVGSRNIQIGLGVDAATFTVVAITADDTVSIGTLAKAGDDDAVAIGNRASTTTVGGVALGSQSVANTVAGIAGYVPTSADPVRAAAINATTGTLAAVSVGDAANNQFRQITGVAAGTANSDAVNVAQLVAAQEAATTRYYSINDGGTQGGNYNNDGATGLNSLAAGVNATATQQNTVAIGNGATVTAIESVAIGRGTTAVGEGEVSLGTASGTGGVATNFANVNIGYVAGNNVNGGGITSIGYQAGTNASGRDSAFIGSNAGQGSAGQNNYAFGSGAGQSTTGNGNLALGTNAGPGGGGTTNNSISIGTFSTPAPGTDRVIAIGYGAYGQQTDAISFGSNAQSMGIGATAIGSGATATNANDVALGSGSVTAAANPTPSGVINGTTYTYAGGAPTSVVSVGKPGLERQITNVAAGQVTATSTDAINGSQLFATNSAINNVIAVASAGWNVTTAATGTGTVTGTTVANVKPGSTLTIAAGDNIALTQSGAGLTIATNPNLVSNSLTINNGGPVINSTGINVNSTKITNLADGSDPGDAVNYSQLTNVTNTLTAAGLNFTDAAGNVIHRDLGATLPVIGSTTALAAGLDTSGVATAGSYSASNVQTYADAATGKLQVQLADNPNFTSVTTGNTTINNNGLTIVGGPSVTTTGINAAGTKITNVAAGTDPTDAVNYSQLSDVSSVANAGWNLTTAATGTGTVTGTVVANVAPGSTQTITAGNNVALTQSGTGLTIATNPDLVSNSLTTGNTVISTNGVAITGGPNSGVALTNAGLDNGGNKISNVAAGTLSSTSTDAVNGSQLFAAGNSTASALGGTSTYNTSTGQVTAGLSVGGNNYNNVQDALSAVNTTASAGWNVTSGATGTGTAVNTGAPANVAPGGNAKFSAGNNIALTQNGTEIQVALSNNVTLDSVTVNGGAVLDSAGLAMNGDKITGLAAGTISAASSEGINGSQLFAAGTSIASSLGGGSTFDPVTGTISASLTVGGNSYNNVQDALNTVNGTAKAGWNVATGAVGSGTATNLGGNANVSPGGTATFTAGNNITVTQKGTEVQVALKDDVSLNSVAANVVSINGGPTLSSNGITMGANDTLDMSGGKITNIAAGTANTDAVNLGQMNQGMTTILNQANSYTDTRFNSLSFDLARVDRNARGGTAGAMAMSQVPQAFEPGMGILGMGISTFMGEQSIAVGYSKASDNGRIVIKATGSYNSRGQGGLAAGVGFQF